MTTYSHSRVSTFEQCRYKFKLQYIDKIKVDIPTTVEAFMGGLVHKALEKLYKDLSFQKINSKESLLKFYNDLWKREWTDDILIVKKEYKAGNYRKMGERYISDYYDRFKPFNQMRIMGLETEDKLTLPDGNKWHVRIDKLGFKDGTYYLCDYKTNSRMKNQEEADEDRQLAMYSIWVKNRFKDAKKVMLTWHMLAFDKDAVSERTDKQLKELQQETINTIKEIEKCKEFPRNVTPLCNYCVFKSICPSFKHEFEIEEKTVKEFKKDDGVKLVDNFAELKSKKYEIEKNMEEIKENLISFAKQKDVDVVFGSNKKASVKPYDKVIYPEDKEKFIKLIKKKGLYDEFSNLNYLKLSPKILKNEVDKAIIKLTDKEEAYRISISKKNKD